MSEMYEICERPTNERFSADTRRVLLYDSSLQTAIAHLLIAALQIAAIVMINRNGHGNG